MNQDQKHIDNQISKKLLQAEVIPPASVWLGIEKALAEKKRKAVILLYRRLGYAAAFLLFGFVSYYFIRSNSEINTLNPKRTQQIVGNTDLIKIDSISRPELLTYEQQKENPSEKSKSNRAKSVHNENIATVATNGLENTVMPNAFVEQTAHPKSLEMNIGRTITESIALHKPLQTIDLTSMYKSNFNVLSFLRAYSFRRAYELDQQTDLLAENKTFANNQSWKLGLAFSPTNVSRSSGFSTREYGALYADASVPTETIASVVSEKDIPAYSGGLNLEFQISERLSLQSGVYYLRQGQLIENFSVIENSANSANSTNSYFGNISITNTSLLSGEAPLSDYLQLNDAVSYSRFDADLLQRFELLEIPLIASYKLIDRKFSFSLAAGLNQGVVIGNQVYLSNYTSQPIGTTEDLNRFIYKSVFGFSFEYPLARKLYFNLSPTLKYQLNNFNKKAIEPEHLRYYEFKAGVSYRF